MGGKTMLQLLREDSGFQFSEWENKFLDHAGKGPTAADYVMMELAIFMYLIKGQERTSNIMKRWTVGIGIFTVVIMAFTILMSIFTVLMYKNICGG